jgi:hypothetical protein
MAEHMRKVVLLISILVAGIFILLFAPNVTQLWVVWLLTIGFFCGSALAPRMGIFAVGVCAISVLAVATTLISRRLPIYALDWRFASRVEISDLSGTWKVALSDPLEIAALMKYGESGHYESMIKGETNFLLYVTRDGTSTGYYIHGDSVGELPGGFWQTVFVPESDGLLQGINQVLARHGHGT